MGKIIRGYERGGQCNLCYRLPGVCPSSDPVWGRELHSSFIVCVRHCLSDICPLHSRNNPVRQILDIPVLERRTLRHRSESLFEVIDL